jgi:hypothetical protein
MNNNKTLEVVRNYKLILADINEIDFRVQELDE